MCFVSMEWQVPVSFRHILYGFNGEHEADNLLDFRPTRTVQAVPIARIVILAVVRSQFVAVRREFVCHR